MIDEKVQIMINEYFDRELGTEKENYLFSVLSSDEESRNYFKEMNRLKMLVNSGMEEFPIGIDAKIKAAVSTGQRAVGGERWAMGGNRYSVGKKIVNYFAYAVFLAVIVAGFFLYRGYENQNMRLQTTEQILEKQEELLKLITTNQLTPVTVEPEYKNEIIIKANI